MLCGIILIKVKNSELDEQQTVAWKRKHPKCLMRGRFFWPSEPFQRILWATKHN
jgi:hypothetical protein